MSELRYFSFNRYSQNGEDGIINEILRRLGIDDENRWCVEFGAWDGKLNSNTFALVERGWQAIYIEADKERFAELQKTAQAHPAIVPMNEFVSPDKKAPTSLDNLLRRTRIPKQFELLSIDIDSFDAEVWEGLSGYQPAIVIIEVNSSIPPGLMGRHIETGAGATFSSVLEIGVAKGYTLVTHTGNMIFVRNDLMPLMQLTSLGSAEQLFLRDWIGFEPEQRKPRLSIFSRVIRRLGLTR